MVSPDGGVIGSLWVIQILFFQSSDWPYSWMAASGTAAVGIAGCQNRGWTTGTLR
jgi:hypothetical protein